MAVISAKQQKFISLLPDGSPNSLGTVGFYEPGGSFSTAITIWDTQTKDSTLSNPVTLDSNGTKEIWFDTKCDIKELDSDGNSFSGNQTLNVDPNLASTPAINSSLVQNGSFETDTDADGTPNNWTLNAYTGSAIAITSDIATDGDNALEFNTAGAATGGGTATSDKFPVTEGGLVEVRWSFYATNATTTNSFQIKWYDEDDNLQSTSTLTMPTSGSVPTSWTNYSELVQVNAAATKGEAILTGIDEGGSNLTAKAYFDGISIAKATLLIAGDSSGEPVIYDSSGNEILETGKTASAVNQIKITNAATGNPPVISSEGEVDVGMKLNAKDSEEMLELGATTAAVNHTKITSAATGNPPVISAEGEADTGLQINDSNGNEILTLSVVSGAQNYVDIKNSTARVEIGALGDDAGISIDLVPKGSGKISISNVAIGRAVYVGQLADGSPPTWVSPSGGYSDLTLTRPSTGVYRLTHNWGTTDVVCVASAIDGTDRFCNVQNLNTNYVEIQVLDASTSGFVNQDIMFILVRHG